MNQVLFARYNSISVVVCNPVQSPDVSLHHLTLGEYNSQLALCTNYNKQPA